MRGVFELLICAKLVVQWSSKSSLVSAGQADRWSAERARKWGERQPWRLGANYLPSHCANVLDMFDSRSFDATLLSMERELQNAQAVGFSTLRIFLHEELFFRRGERFLDDVEKLLDLLGRRSMSAMVVLFDACWRPDLEKASPIPGVHNSAWVQCPTHNLLRAFVEGDEGARERLRSYVMSVVGRFAKDSRVSVWDIYNEPSMRDSEHWILPRLAAAEGWSTHPSHWLLDGKKFEATFSLLKEAFAWARSAGPTQPLTTAIWEFPSREDEVDVQRFKTTLNHHLLELSDVVSLHCYCEPEDLESRVLELGAARRGPVLVTEFMARPRNSTLQGSLPVLAKHGAWGYTWGLFRGRSQAHRPWDTWVRGDIPEDETWFHDVFFENGTAYDPEEIKEIWWHAIGRHLSHDNL